MTALRVGAFYFVCVFGAGFVLGTIRVTLVVPRLGMRLAELAEMPLMLAVVVLAARWIVGRERPAPGPRVRLAAGAVALALLVTAELALVGLQGQRIRDYVASRDPVSGSAYLLMLLVFAAMPLVVGRAQPGSRGA